MRPLTSEQQALVADNHNLIYAFLKKYNLSIDEWYDIVAIGLCKAGASYNSKSGYAFATYAYTCMYNEVKIQYRRNSALSRVSDLLVCSLDTRICDDGEHGCDTFEELVAGNSDFVEDLTWSDVAKEVISKLSDNDKSILKYKLDGLTQQDISQVMNVSQSHVHRRLSYIRDRIRKATT